MSTRPCDGGCGAVINNKAGRRYCVGCYSERKAAWKEAGRARKRAAEPTRTPVETPEPATLTCKHCGLDFVPIRQVSAYCSVRCNQRALRAGARVRRTYNMPRPRKSDAAELGPKHPLIRPDVEGMKRRALTAACDDLGEELMLERFGHGIAMWAIGEAHRLGRRNCGKGLRMLPCGLPA